MGTGLTVGRWTGDGLPVPDGKALDIGLWRMPSSKNGLAPGG